MIYQKNKNKHSLDELVPNLRNIALKYCPFRITKAYISKSINSKTLPQTLALADLLTTEIFKEHIYTKIVSITWSMENVVWLEILFIIYIF